MPVYSDSKPLASAESVVELEGISKAYELAGREEKVWALRNMTLSEQSAAGPVKRGEFVMIRGPSGGGKTTLLNLIGTIDSPTGGTLRLLDEVIDTNVSDARLSQIRLSKIGFVFQTFNLLASASALENVELPMTMLGERSASEVTARAEELLKMVGLQDRMNHLPCELSGGEQQRVTIARSLANEPQLILLDEPTGDLDSQNTVEVMNLLLRLNQEQRVTMIMVSHNPDLECYADRVLYVADGKFVKQAINEQQIELTVEGYAEYLHRNHSKRKED